MPFGYGLLFIYPLVVCHLDAS